MNKMQFCVDNYDEIVSINYTEKYNDETSFYNISLEQVQAKAFFNKFTRLFPDFVENIEDDYIAFDFYDIDVNLADKMIKLSDDQSELRNKNNNENSKKEYRVKRRNKFKKVFVSVSATTLATLTLFCIPKTAEAVDDIELPDLGEMVEEIEESFKNNGNIKIKNTKENLIVETKTDNEIKQEIQEEIKEEPIIEEDKNVFEDIVHDIIYIPSPEEEITQNEPEHDVLSLNADDWTNTEKYQIAKAYYYDTICKYANMYGLDPNVVLAICTHERGLHSDIVDSGGAVGLFQIQVEGNWNWNNQQVTAYNFNTNSWETKVISKDEVSDVFENIKVGCMILQTILREQEYNVPRAIQSYNYGTNYMETVLNTCCNAENCTREDLKNQYNLSWLKYRNIIQNGDQEYLENIFKYIENGTQLTFKTPNGDSIEFIYENLNNTRVM